MTEHHVHPILVTGGSGFLGSQVVTDLCRSGLGGRVHLLMRKDPTADSVLGLRFKAAELDLEEVRPRIHHADLADEPGLRAQLANLALISSEWAVVHLAAVINPEGDFATQERVNFAATRVLVEWANTHGSRIVYTSSVVAFGATPGPSFRSEEDYDHYPILNRLDSYSLSKRRAHDMMLRESKISTFVFCPGIIHGAFEHMKSSRAHLKKVLEGKLKWVPGGGGSFVSLDHVSAAVIAGILIPSSGKELIVKILADVCIPYVDYFHIFRESAGLPRMKLKKIPSFLCWPVGLVAWLCRLVGKEIPILSKLIQALMFYYFRTGSSREEGDANLRRAIAQSLSFKG